MKQHLYHYFRVSLLPDKGFVTLSSKFSKQRVRYRQTLHSVHFFKMEFLQGYESDSYESTDIENMTNKEVDASAVLSSMPGLNARAVRQVYLITYSQADSEKFPIRQSFAQAVVCSFNGMDTNNVEHWVCCKEAHQITGFCY